MRIGIPDEDYAAAGTEVLGEAEVLWGPAELLLEVKEPIASEYGFLRPRRLGSTGLSSVLS